MVAAGGVVVPEGLSTIGLDSLCRCAYFNRDTAAVIDTGTTRGTRRAPKRAIVEVVPA